jgi:hypothetical protein
MAKRSFRTLYEMMRSDREAVPPGLGVPSESEGSVETVKRLLAPGRTFRVPAGYLLIALAVVVLLLAASYMLGYKHSQRVEKASFDEWLRKNWVTSGGVDDPLTPAQASPVAVDTPIIRIEEPLETTPAPSPPPARASTGGGFHPIDADPRQAGIHYMILVETREDGALRLARFCRDEGLEAYVVRGYKGSLRRVIVLPGLSGHDDPRHRPLRERINEVGRAWKRLRPSESDLGDAYLMKFDG